jgi:hypothetical protein
MCEHAYTRWLVLIVLLTATWLPFGSASAQLQATVRISQPTIGEFPQISLYVAVIDSSGRHIPGLPTSSFSVIEDENELSDVAVNEKKIGTRQVFVINTSSELALRDSLGRTRFERTRTALLDWWKLPEISLHGIDDLSLITTEGVLVNHSSSTADLASTLDHLTPDFEDNVSGYDLLLNALEASSEPASMLGMPTHIIFFTSLLHLPRDVPLANIIARSQDTSTTIHPILMGAPEVMQQPEIEPLRQLADATGGQLLLLDSSQGLTQLADKIIAQRIQYQLTYTSRVSSPGPHQVQIRVTGDGLDAISELQNYEIDVQPPEVAFIQPPEEIIRQTDDPTMALAAMAPTSQTIQLLITFPDKHPRAITSSQIIVDGVVVAQYSEAPFDYFMWDLSNYLESESHTIKAIVEDSLGLVGSSITHSVDLKVITPPRGLAALKPALGSLLAALAVLIAGLVLAVGLISMGRQRLAPAILRKQPSPQQKKGLKRAGLRPLSTSQPAEAYLVLHDSQGEEGDAVPLTGIDFILGRDPSLTSFPIDDPSVESMHARLIRQAAGDYLLRDQGSVAGTWVNFELVPDEGRLLKHGDIIHVGRATFRFRLQTPPSPPNIRVQSLEDEGLGTHSE